MLTEESTFTKQSHKNGLFNPTNQAISFHQPLENFDMNSGNLWPRATGWRRGFTLIELLPALARAKLKATNAACLNNQKQLLLAFIMYTHDNADKMVYTVGAGGQYA